MYLLPGMGHCRPVNKRKLCVRVFNLSATVTCKTQTYSNLWVAYVTTLACLFCAVFGFKNGLPSISLQLTSQSTL